MTIEIVQQGWGYRFRVDCVHCLTVFLYDREDTWLEEGNASDRWVTCPSCEEACAHLRGTKVARGCPDAGPDPEE